MEIRVRWLSHNSYPYTYIYEGVNSSTNETLISFHVQPAIDNCGIVNIYNFHTKRIKYCKEFWKLAVPKLIQQYKLKALLATDGRSKCGKVPSTTMGAFCNATGWDKVRIGYNRASGRYTTIYTTHLENY